MSSDDDDDDNDDDLSEAEEVMGEVDNGSNHHDDTSDADRSEPSDTGHDHDDQSHTERLDADADADADADVDLDVEEDDGSQAPTDEEEEEDDAMDGDDDDDEEDIDHSESNFGHSTNADEDGGAKSATTSPEGKASLLESPAASSHPNTPADTPKTPKSGGTSTSASNKTTTHNKSSASTGASASASATANVATDGEPKRKKRKGMPAGLGGSRKGRAPAVRGLTIPFRTVKKAMKLDPDIPIVQNEAAIMTTLASELFLKALAQDSYDNAKARGRNTIRYEDVAEARTKKPSLSFLETLLP